MPRADWVFRPNTHDEAGAIVDGQGSYEPTATTLTPGLGNALVKVLYDSHNRVNKVISTGNFISGMPSAARAEGGRARILRVRGQVLWIPSTWAVGSGFRFGLRFGMFEQDADTGTILLGAAYTMWTATVIDQNSPAVWANNRWWAHERRIVANFNDNSSLFATRFNFPVNRSLAPHICYGVYMETFAGSTTLNVQPWLSTLVADEG